MSGTGARWTPERRAAQAERMRQNNRDRAYAEHRIAAVKASTFNRVRKASLMRKLNKRRADDIDLNRRWRVAISRANLKPERREQLRRQMIAIHRYWEQERDRPDIVAMRSERGRRAAASKRGLALPPELMPVYERIRRKVGMREAVRIMAEQLERQP
jgi:hypothetical protein